MKGIVLTSMEKTDGKFGEGTDTISLKYVDLANEVQGTRFGALTSESRYAALISQYNLAVHGLTAANSDVHLNESDLANAISAYNKALQALIVPGSITKKMVAPYEIDNVTRTTRIIVKFEHESWDDAILLAGSRPVGSEAEASETTELSQEPVSSVKPADAVIEEDPEF